MKTLRSVTVRLRNLSVLLRYYTIEEFNVDLKAECTA